MEISEFGSVVVLSKYLNEIMKKLPNDIHIKSERNDSITIKSGDIETKLNGFNSNEYPKLPEMDPNNRESPVWKTNGGNKANCVCSFKKPS